MYKEKLIKEVKRACPYALELVRQGANPAQMKSYRGKKLKKDVRKLLTKFSYSLIMER